MEPVSTVLTTLLGYAIALVASRFGVPNPLLPKGPVPPAPAPVPEPSPAPAPVPAPAKPSDELKLKELLDWLLDAKDKPLSDKAKALLSLVKGLLDGLK